MKERLFSQSELSRLLSKKRWPNEQSREYWFLSATLGLAEDEVSGLTWKDIESREGFISVPDISKGIRLIPLSPSAKVFLDDIAATRRGSPQDIVFPQEPTAEQDLNQAAQDCGLIKSSESLSPEILKRSFLKFLLENGKDRTELEEIYGDVPE